RVLAALAVHDVLELGMAGHAGGLVGAPRWARDWIRPVIGARWAQIQISATKQDGHRARSLGTPQISPNARWPRCQARDSRRAAARSAPYSCDKPFVRAQLRRGCELSTEASGSAAAKPAGHRELTFH